MTAFTYALTINGFEELLLFSKSKEISMPEIIPECYDCNVFPKCLGGCYANRTENNIYCSIEKYYINTYLNMKLKNIIKL